MKSRDIPNWKAKNVRLNAGHVLKVGDKITDWNGRQSTIDNIVIPKSLSIENHGTIYVYAHYDKGGVEHYVYFGWESNFRVARV